MKLGSSSPFGFLGVFQSDLRGEATFWCFSTKSVRRIFRGRPTECHPCPNPMFGTRSGIHRFHGNSTLPKFNLSHSRDLISALFLNDPVLLGNRTPFSSRQSYAGSLCLKATIWQSRGLHDGFNPGRTFGTHPKHQHGA